MLNATVAQRLPDIRRGSLLSRLTYQLLVFTGLSALCATCPAQEPPLDPMDGQRWAVILVGLPGDEEHAALFQQTADAWEHWLTAELQFPAEHVVRLPARQAELDKNTPAATAEGMAKTLSDLSRKLGVNDSLWLFTLGHGNYDGKLSWFHVPGRDPSEEDFARWLRPIRCREQVLWLTHSSSGWLVKPLSRPGRIVIAATAADDEENETEFPHALATVAKKPAAQLDGDQDQRVSVAELFKAVVDEVDRRFKSDKRLPTEHAQLDDNGDGRGSEDLTPPQSGATPPAKIDGALANKTFAGYRTADPPATQPPAEAPEPTVE